MTEFAESRPQRQILAIVYTDGIIADRFIANLGYFLRNAGLHVAGLVQHNHFVRDRRKCNMEVEELASGTSLRLSEFRGNAARGCRLDRAALCDASELLMDAIAKKPAVLILNKFGKVEAEGGGLRDAIAKAAELGTSIIVGVPTRNLDQWRVFAGDLAEETTVESIYVERWLSARNFVTLPTQTVEQQRSAFGSATTCSGPQHGFACATRTSRSPEPSP